jgi:hypothetical protein
MGSCASFSMEFPFQVPARCRGLRESEPVIEFAQRLMPPSEGLRSAISCRLSEGMDPGFLKTMDPRVPRRMTALTVLQPSRSCPVWLRCAFTSAPRQLLESAAAGLIRAA